MSEENEQIDEVVRLVMKYTGWDCENAKSAITAWTLADPSWTAQYIAEQLAYEEENDCAP